MLLYVQLCQMGEWKAVGQGHPTAHVNVAHRKIRHVDIHRQSKTELQLLDSRLHGNDEGDGHDQARPGHLDLVAARKNSRFILAIIETFISFGQTASHSY